MRPEEVAALTTEPVKHGQSTTTTKTQKLSKGASLIITTTETPLN